MEKTKRVKIRDKENSSRLVITQLDVLDSGYYQCIVSNPAASVNTTSVLRVSWNFLDEWEYVASWDVVLEKCQNVPSTVTS